MFQKARISEHGNATDLGIICFDDVVIVTVEIPKRKLIRTDCKGTGKSVVANCDSILGSDNAVDFMETA